VISGFSSKGDWVLDPFMGGGTTIIEGLALGRRLIGVDINALAHFVTTVRTRPISSEDEEVIRRWAQLVAKFVSDSDIGWIARAPVRNLPTSVGLFMSGAIDLTITMRGRQRAFARCALLRLGQWALDCRDFDAPRRKKLASRLPELIEEMFEGLREFNRVCRAAHISGGGVVRNRVLLNRSAVGLEEEPIFAEQGVRPRLVLTSPPYPGVNVLYHRWQYKGRKETPAPYWIANVPDGYGQSFYTGGSRTPTGLKNYVNMIIGAFRSVARILAPSGYVVQLVGFSDASKHLPLYLRCMRAAGLEECEIHGDRLARRVPNRKWYAKLKGDVDASTELLLIHRRSKGSMQNC
jgi:DNA methylase